MKKYRRLKTVASLAVCIVLGACTTRTQIPDPQAPKSMSPAPESIDTAEFDSDVAAYMRGRFNVVSARYYYTAGGAEWLSIAKNVEDQFWGSPMKRVDMGWLEGGINTIQVFATSDDREGFAVAQSNGTKRNGEERLVGYYKLKGARVPTDGR